MVTLKSLAKRLTLLAAIGTMMISGSGCTLFFGHMKNLGTFIWFWETLPPVPVPAYWSQQVEDTYWEEERYKRVPVLPPVEGENAPLFCLDPPSPDEIMRALPDDTAGGVPFLAEVQRNNVRITVEPLVDRIDECKFFPGVGPARLHHCHYKCTVYFDRMERSYWPIPYSHTDQTQEVVYIDHDHLIRCAGPGE